MLLLINCMVHRNKVFLTVIWLKKLKTSVNHLFCYSSMSNFGKKCTKKFHICKNVVYLKQKYHVKIMMNNICKCQLTSFLIVQLAFILPRFVRCSRSSRVEIRFVSRNLEKWRSTLTF